MAAFTIGKLKRIDILVCNAGIVRSQLIGAMKLDDWEAVLQTNLRGVFLCIREVLPYMMTQRHGSIINISSITADHGSRGQCNYAASKGGINAMTRSLAVELARKGIRVNAVSPGVILTEMTDRIRYFAGEELQKQIPLKRYGTPGDVAKAVRFLVSKDAGYITGEVLHVTGGLGI
jgi:3-oxoacyl-[acyl-carrier protein] reductase